MENEMNNDRVKSTVDEFLSFLQIPSSLEQLDDTLTVLNEPVVKKYKTVCSETPDVATKTMELIAKNIHSLDYFKVGLTCNIFSEMLDLTSPSTFVSSYILGIFVRTLVLSDRYLYKSLNFIENIDIMANSPDEVRAWKCLDEVVSAAITVLSCSPQARIRLRENKNYFMLIMKLKTYISPLEEIFRIYRLTDNEELIVINPERHVGYRVVINAIQNNFHLFTLLQNEIVQKEGFPSGKNYTPENDAVLYAKGERKFDIDRKIPDSAVFSFYSWNAYAESLKNKSPLPQNCLINGKKSPMIIPSLNGSKIIIISSPSNPPISWDTSEFKPINALLTSDVKITEILDDDAVSNILRSATKL